MTETFTLAGKQFCYQHSDYNGTRFNERAVEVPVGLALLEQARQRNAAVLEVGAVLPHYGANSHAVIDLYEVYPGVINANVLTWEPPQAYDLIISISTLDHLCDDDEFSKAMKRLTSWVAPGGLLYVTLPFGQPAWVGGGPWLDRWLLVKSLGGVTPSSESVIWRMDKVDVSRHLWKQVEDKTIPPLAYHGQSPAANSVYFVLWGDSGRPSVYDWWHT